MASNVFKVYSIVLALHGSCFCQECVLSLHRDLPKKHEPLYFVQNGNSLDLLMPHMVGQDGVMTLSEGQQVVLACPGKGNKLTVSGAEATLSKCAGGVMLNIEDRQFPTYQLECENPAQAKLKITSDNCGCDQGKELRIGFEGPDGGVLEDIPFLSFWGVATALWQLVWGKSENDIQSSHWINLITTCHNLEGSETLYSVHIIYGKTLAGAEMKYSRPQFSQGNENLYPGFNPDTYYRKKVNRQVLLKYDTKDYNITTALTCGPLDLRFQEGCFYFNANYCGQMGKSNNGPQTSNIAQGLIPTDKGRYLPNLSPSENI